MVFVTCQHVDEVRKWQSYYARLFRRADAPLSTSALDAWSLLTTQLPTALVAGRVKRQYESVMSMLLRSKSVEVRSAAGEALALLYEAQWIRQRDQEENGDDDQDDEEIDEDDGDNDLDEFEELTLITDEMTEDESNVFRNDPDLDDDDDNYVDVDVLVTTLSGLATDATRSMGRKERSL
jgi:hypothetical protein